MKFMNNLRKRGLALFLVLTMCMSMLPTTALAVEDDQNQVTHNETELASVADGKVQTSKTILQTGENKFDITLKVKTKVEIQEQTVSKDAAVVLVLDTSNSMITDSTNYLTNAKNAAKAFLKDFVTDTGDGVRKVAVVEFGSNAYTALDWTDASLVNNALDATTTAGVDAVQVGFSYTYSYQCNQWGRHAHGYDLYDGSHTMTVTGTDRGGTNIEAGLILAKNLLADSRIAGTTAEDGTVTGKIENTYVVLMTDGAPTYHVADSDEGTGSITFIKGSMGGNTYAQHADYHDVYCVKTDHGNLGASDNVAAAITSSAKLYSVYYATSNNEPQVDTTYVSTWMANFSTQALVAGGNIDIATALRNVALIIAEQAEAWKLTDPMGPFVKFDEGQGGIAYDVDEDSSAVVKFDSETNTLTWDLKNDAAHKSGPDADGYYTYTLTYSVTLDTAAKGFDANVDYPTNGVTTLTYMYKDANGDYVSSGTNEDGTKTYLHGTNLDVPKVEGEVPMVTYTVNYLYQNAAGEYVADSAKTVKFQPVKMWSKITVSEDSDVTPGYHLHDDTDDEIYKNDLGEQTLSAANMVFNVYYDPDPDVPNVSVTKVPVKATYTEGEPVQWTITVKNNGTTKVEGLKLVDTLLDGAEGTVTLTNANDKDYTNFSLEVNETAVFTATLAGATVGTYYNYVVVEKDGEKLDDDSTKGEVDPTDPEKPPVDPKPIEVKPNVSVTKTPVEPTYTEGPEGVDIQWKIKVKNNGKTDLKDLTLVDTLKGTGTVKVTDSNGREVDKFDLAAGAEVTFIATLKGAKAGTYYNSVVVKQGDKELAKDDTETPVDPTDPEKPAPPKPIEVVEPDPDPDPVGKVTVEKTVYGDIPESLEAGDVIIWEIVLTNDNSEDTYVEGISDVLTVVNNGGSDEEVLDVYESLDFFKKVDNIFVPANGTRTLYARYTVKAGDTALYNTATAVTPDAPEDDDTDTGTAKIEYYTLIYNANGGKATSAPTIDKALVGEDGNATFTVKDGVPTRENYEFLGWSTTPNGGVEYEAGDKLTVNANTVLYAVWQAVPVEMKPEVAVIYLIEYWIDGESTPFDTARKVVELANRDATVDVQVGLSDIQDVEGYSFNAGKSELTGTVKFIESADDIVILKVVYTEDHVPQPGESDIAVTKTANQTTAKVDDTVTWTITVTNTNEDGYPYIGLKLVDLLNSEENPDVTIGYGVYDAFLRDAGIAPFTPELDETPAEEPEEEITEEPAEEAAEEITEEPTEEITEDPAEDLEQIEQAMIFASASADPADFDLWPGETVTFTASYVVKDGDIKLENAVVIYAGTDPDPVGGDKADDVDVTYPADLSVEKTRTSAATAAVGETITWDIVITNNGKGGAENVVISDRLSNGRSAVLDQYVVNVPANSSVTVRASYVVTADDAGSTLTNTVYVTNPDDDKVVEDTDDGTDIPNVTTPRPGMYVNKTADRTTASVGDVITYTITVTNTGNVELTNIVVSDPMMANGGTTIAALAVGASETIRYTYTVTAAEAGTTLRNTVSVNGVNPNPGQVDPDPVEDEVNTEIDPVPAPPAIPTPGITLPAGPTPLAPAPGVTIADEAVPLAAPGLNSVDHVDYVQGYPDGTVRPEANITRAEVATIFFRLMTNEYRMENWATENDFSDVEAGAWYNNAISTAAQAGLLNGYTDGSFLPGNNITRAEFATLAARFTSDEEVQTGRFSDISGHWAEMYIERAAAAGWITGENGKFRPDDYITRAEVIVVVNRMLDRVPDEDHLLEGMKTFVDNQPGMWYYADVQEATNHHDYERDETGVVEIWTELLPDQDWTALEKEWANAADVYVADVAAGLNGEHESEGEGETPAED